MMREIKFRAYYKNVNKIFKVSSIDFLRKKVKLSSRCFLVGNLFYEVDFNDIELLQYIGYKDKKVVEIYDKDIVAIAGMGICIVELDLLNGVNFIHEDKGDFSYYEVAGDIEEVIGNIYQNPELLDVLS